MSTTSGIDLGSDAIKGVVLKAGKRGPVEVVSAGTMPIADLARLPDSPDKTLAIGEKLKELVKSAHLKADTRRLGASGGHTSIRYLQIPPVPPWRLEMLVKYEVEERNEEKENHAYDFHIMDVPETSGQYTVIVGTMSDRYAGELLATARQSGLGEVELDLEAMALFSAYYHGHGFDADKTVAIADIGTDDITVLICRNGTLFYARTMMGGGKRFTQNLADDLKIDAAEAEELKKTSAEIFFDVAPSASSAGASAINRAPRLPRPGASASGAVIPMRSAVSKAVPGGTAMFRNPAASTPAASAAPATSAAQLTPATPATPAASAAPAPKPAPAKTDDLTYDLLDPDLLDSSIKSAPSVAAKTQIDDLELQLEAEKSTGPKVPEPLAATQILPAPSASILNQNPKINNAAPSPVHPFTPSPVQPLTPSAVHASDEYGSSNDMSAPDNDSKTLTPEERDKRKRQISAALVREAAGLCAAIENVLMTCKAQSKQPLKLDRIYITGGASQLKGLREFMSRRLRVEVQYLEPLRNLSLQRLKPEAREALKAEQHTFHTALGLALSDLRPGAQSFLIWPNALKQRKEFWARGAYLYYAAGAAAIALGVMLYSPARNTDKLVANNAIATAAVQQAERESNDAAKLKKDNDEFRHRLKTITDNVQSGDYFLNVLAELKSKLRIRDDIYLTSVSTSLPNVVIVESDEDTKRSPDGLAVPKNAAEVKALLEKAAALNRGEPSSFQAQRRVYIRGIARGPRPDGLIELIEDFSKRLVPYPNDPENPQNLFKDIRHLWFSKEDNKQGNYYLKEFVLEAYTEKPPAQVAALTPKKGAPVKPGTPAAPNLPGVVPPSQNIQPPQPAVPVVNRLPVQPAIAPAQIPNAVPPGTPVPATPAVQKPDALLPYLKGLFQNDPKPQAPTAPPATPAPVPIDIAPAVEALPAQPVQPVQPKIKQIRKFVTPGEPAPPADPAPK